MLRVLEKEKEQGKRDLEWPKQGGRVSENTVLNWVWPLFCSKTLLTHPFKKLFDGQWPALSAVGGAGNWIDRTLP